MKGAWPPAPEWPLRANRNVTAGGRRSASAKPPACRRVRATRAVARPLTRDERAQLKLLADLAIAARGAAGMTQEDLVAAAGVSSRYIQKLESGAFNPSYVKLIAVARALDRHGRVLLALD